MTSQGTAQTNPNNTIIPFHFWDDVPYTRGICLNVTLRFEEVLDTAKLQESLERLLEIGDWRKLGARLHQNVKINIHPDSQVPLLIHHQEAGKLEYHLPSKFTNNRPGIIFTTANQPNPISSHPLASQIPSTQETSQISVLGCMSSFNSITKHDDAPNKIEDYLSSDIPQLFIHVVTFTDTTLITVTFPHTLFDAMGLSYFLQAWTAILSDQEDRIPAFLGFDEDIIEAKTEYVPAEQHVLAKKTLTRFQMAVLVLSRWWENYWYPDVQDKVITIPNTYVQRMQERALQELRAQSSQSSRSLSEDIFVSEGDILLAWLSKTLVNALNPSPQTPVQISNVFDTRAVLNISQAGAYTGNATIPSCTTFTAQSLQKSPTSNTALHLRNALNEQRIPSQVHAMSSLRKKSLRETGFLPIIGVPRQISITCTNWYRARFFDLDFSSARVDRACAGACRPSYINTAGPTPLGPHVARNLVTVTGRDGVGNWWVQILARAGAWERIEEVVRGLEVDV
ncbi:hypothetical protein PEBR_05855 [Penicillium brasilianum]|uniref:LysR family regulatory protein n=1 Tax=Penicillium brasilianum TaxID=104259 RepID=A0A1S9RWT1_PENBI|nr:hypothetical protein PEBR_05855 [Penicillium brasilianum]